MWEEILTEDAELLIVAYGISSRIARAAVEIARADGVRVGLLRPISLYPLSHETPASVGRKSLFRSWSWNSAAAS